MKTTPSAPIHHVHPEDTEEGAVLMCVEASYCYKKADGSAMVISVVETEDFLIRKISESPSPATPKTFYAISAHNSATLKERIADKGMD